MARALHPRPALGIEPGTLVIGDLHLDVGGTAPEPESSVHGFLGWLAEAAAAPRLIVLGDLFDAWIGPAQGRLPEARRVLEGFRAATSRGLRLDVLHGNRDFLLGPDFEAATGARVWPRGLVGEPVDAPDRRILFVHGDELCTLDHAYQRLRRVVRSRPVQALAPRLPTSVALGLARRLRRASVQAVAAKPSAEKSQQPEAAVRLALEEAAPTLVCGHAHRWRDEALPGGPRWVVLDAWGGARDVLRIGPGGRLEPGSSAANLAPSP